MNETDRIVHHYTSLSGLFGITECQSIWATNILYLNDASELHYAKKLLQEELAIFRDKNQEFTRAATLEKSMGHFFLEAIESNISTLLPSQPISFFVCSFSEEGDLLSQWRGYSKSSTGFCLGFSLNKLKAIAEKGRFSIRKVIYDRDLQVAGIQRLLADVATKFTSDIANAVDKGLAWDEKGKLLLSELFLEFIRFAPLLKHPKFAEEKEWRIVAALKTNYISNAVKFRAGGSMVVPYIEVPLPLEGESLAIKEVIVGPTSEGALSAESVEMLLKSRKVVCSAVKYSTIPYRTT